MATLSAADIYALARGAGWSADQAVTATAIALAESGGRTDARGDVGIQTSKWGPSVGLWQIRSLKADTGTGRPRDASRLTDPRFNAGAAFTIFRGAGGFSPWSVYKSGSYQRHMAAAKAAAGGGGNAALDALGVVSPFVGAAAENATSGSGNPITNTVEAIAGIPDALNRGVNAMILAVMAGVVFVVGGYLIVRGGNLRSDASKVVGATVRTKKARNLAKIADAKELAPREVIG